MTIGVTGKIIRDVPLFRHCSEEEIFYLQKIGGLSAIRKGQFFDLKKVNSFNIVVNGFFEIEALGRTDIVYLAPGSFFGTIPFTSNRHHGKIRAIADSTLLLFKAEDLYRFFLGSYRGLRGYLKTISRMGFELSDTGNLYQGENCRVTAVYGGERESGNTLVSALIGLSLREKGKTVILDCAYEGNSVFNLFGKKITAPISQREEDGPAIEQIIRERIEAVDENLHLMNITFGSKVRADRDILSPVLFILSRRYSHVILDLSGSDREFRDRALDLSDTVFAAVRNMKGLDPLYSLFDRVLSGGQSVYYVINEFYAGTTRRFTGGLILEKMNLPRDGEARKALSDLADKGVVSEMAGLASKRRRALVLETNFLESIYLAGFFNALAESGLEVDTIYASSLGFVVTGLHLVADSREDFSRSVSRLFSEERLNRLMDITFPDEYIFKNSSIVKFATEAAGQSRMESYLSSPVALLGRAGTGGRRAFCTGYLRDMMAASFLMYPIFEDLNIAEDSYNSGYPELRVRVEDMFRTDADEIFFVSVDNKAPLEFRRGRILKFYEKYIDLTAQKPYADKISDLADRNLVIEAPETDLRVEKILKQSEEHSARLLKDLG